MEPTLEELLKMAELLDPDDLVDRLGLTSTEIILAFSTRVTERAEMFEFELERSRDCAVWRNC